MCRFSQQQQQLLRHAHFCSLTHLPGNNSNIKPSTRIRLPLHTVYAQQHCGFTTSKGHAVSSVDSAANKNIVEDERSGEVTAVVEVLTSKTASKEQLLTACASLHQICQSVHNLRREQLRQSPQSTAAARQSSEGYELVGCVLPLLDLMARADEAEVVTAACKAFGGVVRYSIEGYKQIAVPRRNAHVLVTLLSTSVHGGVVDALLLALARHSSNALAVHYLCASLRAIVIYSTDHNVSDEQRMRVLDALVATITRQQTAAATAADTGTVIAAVQQAMRQICVAHYRSTPLSRPLVDVQQSIVVALAAMKLHRGDIKIQRAAGYYLLTLIRLADDTHQHRNMIARQHGAQQLVDTITASPANVDVFELAGELYLALAECPQHQQLHQGDDNMSTFIDTAHQHTASTHVAVMLFRLIDSMSKNTAGKETHAVAAVLVHMKAHESDVDVVNRGLESLALLVDNNNQHSRQFDEQGGVELIMTALARHGSTELDCDSVAMIIIDSVLSYPPIADRFVQQQAVAALDALESSGKVVAYARDMLMRKEEIQAALPEAKRAKISSLLEQLTTGLTTDTEQADIMRALLDAIDYDSVNSEWPAFAVARHGGVTAVLTAISAQAANRVVVAEALRLYFILDNNCSNICRYQLVSEDGLSLLLDVLQQHQHDNEVCHLACFVCLLVVGNKFDISGDEAVRMNERLLQADVAHTLHNVMVRHPHDTKLVEISQLLIDLAAATETEMSAIISAAIAEP